MARHRTKIATVLLVAAASYAIFMMGWPQKAGNKENIAALQPPLAAVTFFDSDEQPVTLDRFKGKTILVNLWATWCPPCIAELPSLDRLQAKLKDKNFEVVAVSLDKPPLEDILSFLKGRDVDHLTFYWDKNREVDRKWKFAGIPASFLIDGEGTVIKRFDGTYEWDKGAMFDEVAGHIKE